MTKAPTDDTALDLKALNTFPFAFRQIAILAIRRGQDRSDCTVYGPSCRTVCQEPRELVRSLVGQNRVLRFPWGAQKPLEPVPVKNMISQVRSRREPRDQKQ